MEHAERENVVQPNVYTCELINPQYILNSSDKELLTQAGIEVEIESEIEGFTRYRRGKEVITSTSYKKAEKTADYFVQLNEKTFGKVIFFIKWHSANLAVIDEFIVSGMFDHIYALERTNLKQVVNVNSIKEKCIYINVEQNHYAAKQPNSFEKD